MRTDLVRRQEHGAHRQAGDRERDQHARMPVRDAAHIRTCCIYRRVDGALHVGRAIVGSYDIAASVELHDVGQLDQLRGARARQQEMVLLDGMAKADMAVCVNRTDMGEDTVGDHEIDEREFQTAHGDRLVPLASTPECSGSPLGRIARPGAA